MAAFHAHQVHDEAAGWEAVEEMCVVVDTLHESPWTMRQWWGSAAGQLGVCQRLLEMAGELELRSVLRPEGIDRSEMIAMIRWLLDDRKLLAQWERALEAECLMDLSEMAKEADTVPFVMRPVGRLDAPGRRFGTIRCSVRRAESRDGLRRRHVCQRRRRTGRAN